MDIGVADSLGLETTENQQAAKAGLGRKLAKPGNLIAALLLTVVLVAASWAVYTYLVPHKVIDSSGVVIETDSPENTVTSFYELVARKRYEPAANLQTKESRKIVKSQDLKAQYDQVGMEAARLAKVYDSVIKGNLAVVGSIRITKFIGNSYETPVAGITVLTNSTDSGKWEIVNSLQEIPKSDYLNLFEILIKLDSQILKADLSGDGFSENQIKMIKNQMAGMDQFHKEQLKEYKDYLKSQDKKKPADDKK